jgi:O-acetyl-ADP-ribose deacetylase (regulator of RNase III)
MRTGETSHHGGQSGDIHADEEAVRFGRAIIVASAAPILDQPVDAIVCPANRRGVMGVGLSGMVRMTGGIEIEREAMAHAPLTIGTAVETTAGDLAARGVRVILHAVVSDSLGSPTRADIVRRATVSALQAVDRGRLKSVAFPPLGSGLAAIGLTTMMVFTYMIDEIVAHLRRFTSRLERIVLVCRDQREVREIGAALREVRQDWDGLRG